MFLHPTLSTPQINYRWSCVLLGKFHATHLINSCKASPRYFSVKLMLYNYAKVFPSYAIIITKEGKPIGVMASNEGVRVFPMGEASFWSNDYQLKFERKKKAKNGQKSTRSSVIYAGWHTLLWDARVLHLYLGVGGIISSTQSSSTPFVAVGFSRRCGPRGYHGRVPPCRTACGPERRPRSPLAVPGRRPVLSSRLGSAMPRRGMAAVLRRRPPGPLSEPMEGDSPTK